MARDIYKDVLGENGPERDHTTNEGGKHDHWMDKELRSMGKAGEFSADERAMRENRAGMRGKEMPRQVVEERERGDSSAKAREAQKPFEAEPFDVNQFDRE